MTLSRLVRAVTAVAVMLAVLLPALAAAPEAAAQGQCQPAAYIIPGNTVFPEGVVYHVPDQSIFVGATGDGTIYRGERNKAEMEVFLPGGQDGRTTAIGLRTDPRGRLYVSGGATGKMFVYNIADKRLIGAFDGGATPRTFINDVAVAGDNSAYFTDSFAPALHRLVPDGDGFKYERFLDLSNSPIKYADGFNLNGIVAVPGTPYLIVTQSNAGKLYRINTQDKSIVEVDLGGTPMGGDGMILEVNTLYVVSQGQVQTVRLDGSYAKGQVLPPFGSSNLVSPTTIAKVGNCMLVVNSQFNRRSANQPPDLPFTLANIAIPGANQAPVQAGGPAPAAAPAAQPTPAALPTTGGSEQSTLALTLVGLGLALLIGGLAFTARRAR